MRNPPEEPVFEKSATDLTSDVLLRAVDGSGASLNSLEDVEHGPGDAPDVSVSFETFVWRSPIFGGVILDVRSIDRRFLEARLPSISAGVRGRGKAELFGDKLAVQFGLTSEEVEEDSLLDLYRDGLLNYLGLSADLVLVQRVAEVAVEPHVEAEVERHLRALGLRALRD